jgi:sigma-B regulation protein RsbU (phosphoserine phosphatase)
MQGSAPNASDDGRDERRAELGRLAAEVLPGGRRTLDRLLPLFAGYAGGSAAVYLAVDGVYRRESACGPVHFPERVETPPEPSLPFSCGALTWMPRAGGGELPGEALALALAVAAAAREVELGHRLRVTDLETKVRGVQLEALYDVGLAIASTLDFQPLCEEILMRAVSLLDARRGALFLMQGPRFELVRAFGGEAAQELDPRDEEVAELLSGRARPNCCALPGAQHLFGVPIVLDGETKGILVVGDKESRKGVGPFRPEDKRTLELLANQAAIALENAELHRQALEKERLEREIELASQIQRQILPQGAPDIVGYELAGWYRPARHIGGDYYDFFPLPGERRSAIVVGDVSGKGVPAALLVSTLHSALRLLVERESVSAATVARLNRHILESSSANKFITLFLVELDADTGELAFVNAGHNPGLVVRATGAVEELGAGGVPLGLVGDAGFRIDRLRLEPGDLLCLYSDGITEATSPADEEYGLARLSQLLRAHAADPLGAIVAAVDCAVVEFAADRPQGDDQTLVLLRRAN